MPSSSITGITRDFQRDVHCLFGLPVDNLTLASTKVLLRERISQEGNTVLATINVNWVVQSLSDPNFRAAILNSDLVTLDGKMLLWLAKLLFFPMSELVQGSTLIQELLEESSDKPLSIFLFGGDGNAAELAMKRINQRQGGLQAVGALNPGFGTVEAMSTSTIINTINAVKPDILLVALGAKKGTQWIEYNRHLLNAKIISHLGATVNFLAGTVRRAPRFMQNAGLEWVWRIGQEPKLFFRYAGDGLVLLRFLLPRSLLWMEYLRLCTKFRPSHPDVDVSIQELPDKILLSFGKKLRLTVNSPFRQAMSKYVFSEKKLIFDFDKTEFVDSGFLGLLLLAFKERTKLGYPIQFINYNTLAGIFRLCCFLQDPLLKE